VWVGGLPILIIGVLSIAAGGAYTGGAWPLGYHGLGDLFVFVFFGLGAGLGTFFFHTGLLTGRGPGATGPVRPLCPAILVVNNLRDIDTDRAAGKHTLATRLGRPATRWEYLIMLVIAYLVPAALLLAGAAGWWVLLPWLSAPLAVALVRTVLGGAEGR